MAIPRVRRAALETLTTFFRLYSRQKKERKICKLIMLIQHF
jgi:hypothetical protein